MRTTSINVFLFIMALMPVIDSAPPPGQTCTYKPFADVAVLVDSSNSIAKIGYNRSLTFVGNLIDSMPYGPDDVQWTVSIFSNDFVLLFGLGEFSNKEDAIQATLGAPHLKQETETGEAIDNIRTSGIFTDESKGSRPDALKLLFIVTDGRSQDKTKTCEAALALRAEGVRITVITVGVVDIDEAVCIAGSNRSVFSVKSYGDIDTIKQQVIAEICEAVPCVTSQPIHLCVTFDSSSSVGTTNFDYNRVFARRLLTFFKIGYQSTHVTFNVFGTGCYSQIVNSYSILALLEAADNLDYRGSSTHTDLGIDQCVKAIDDDNREGVIGVIVVVTDGKSSYPNRTEVSVAYAKAAGITLVSVGVSDAINFEELEYIASTHNDVFLVDDYTGLEKFAISISTIICEATAPPPTPPQPPTPVPCVTSRPIHLCATIDSSSSIGKDNFECNRAFARRLLQFFTIGDQFTHVTFNVFGTHCYPQIVNSYNIVALIEAALNLEYRASTTSTNLGIDQCVQAIAGDNRQNVHGVIVVVTDGKSTDQQKTKVSVANAKAAGYTVVTVGVGREIDFTELVLIASTPRNVFLVNDYSALELFAYSVSTIICDATLAILGLIG